MHTCAACAPKPYLGCASAVRFSHLHDVERTAEFMWRDVAGSESRMFIGIIRTAGEDHGNEWPKTGLLYIEWNMEAKSCRVFHA